MNTLVVNAGAVTLKLSLVEDDRTAASQEIDPWDDADTDAIAQFLDGVPSPALVAHRVVHGGAELIEPTEVDDEVQRRLEGLGSLAPLHQDRIVAAMSAARAVLPGAVHVACFDAWFHRTMPVEATTYALPESWRRRWSIRRLGFHGYSHAHVAQVAPALVGAGRPGRRIVSCHLGSGASLCAIHDGVSVDTTMGFTPAEGLVMATRSGDVDPGLLMWLCTDAGLEPSEVATAIRDESGLSGLSGGSADMRNVLAGIERGDERARLAFDVYVHRLRGAIGSMAVSLGGIDVLAFTGGVGQHVAAVRSATVSKLGHLGIDIDETANAVTEADADLTATDARAATVVVSTGEHVELARTARIAFVDRAG